jgi:hypothetical protein
MTSVLRKIAAVSAIIVGVVLASNAAPANASSVAKVTKAHVASTRAERGVVSPTDWWW